MRFAALLPGLTAIISSPLVAALPRTGLSDLTSRQTDSCEFDSATAPNCWGNYSLSTNWYEEAPDTGVIREYWFELVNSTLSPDGVPRLSLTINGSIPGPTIEADWGDTVGKHPDTLTASPPPEHRADCRQVVHVKNSLEVTGPVSTGMVSAKREAPTRTAWPPSPNAPWRQETARLTHGRPHRYFSPASPLGMLPY